MESTYGIGINNRYALFLDEEGEENEEMLITKTAEKNAQVKATEPVPAKAAPASAKPAPKATTKPAQGKPGSNKERSQGKLGYSV